MESHSVCSLFSNDSAKREYLLKPSMGIIETPNIFSFCGFDELSLALSQYPPDVLLEQIELLVIRTMEVTFRK